MAKINFIISLFVFPDFFALNANTLDRIKPSGNERIKPVATDNLRLKFKYLPHKVAIMYCRTAPLPAAIKYASKDLYLFSLFFKIGVMPKVSANI